MRRSQEETAKRACAPLPNAAARALDAKLAEDGRQLPPLQLDGGGERDLQWRRGGALLPTRIASLVIPAALRRAYLLGQVLPSGHRHGGPYRLRGAPFPPCAGKQSRASSASALPGVAAQARRPVQVCMDPPISMHRGSSGVPGDRHRSTLLLPTEQPPASPPRGGAGCRNGRAGSTYYWEAGLGAYLLRADDGVRRYEYSVTPCNTAYGYLCSSWPSD